MNWLAHIFLSEQNIDFQIGNYLADPLKGKSWENSSSELKEGIRVHQIIDSFTDAHEVVSKSKRRLREKGLLKAIVIDITYDYFLTKNWDLYCHIPFNEFTQTFYTNANLKMKFLPHKVQVPLNRLIRYKILNNYQKIEQLELGFERFDKRLSTKLLSRDSASSYYIAVKDNILELEKDFLDFFPQLCEKVREEIDINKVNHWKI